VGCALACKNRQTAAQNLPFGQGRNARGAPGEKKEITRNISHGGRLVKAAERCEFTQRIAFPSLPLSLLGAPSRPTEHRRVVPPSPALLFIKNFFSDEAPGPFPFFSPLNKERQKKTGSAPKRKAENKRGAPSYKSARRLNFFNSLCSGRQAAAGGGTA